ncbi:MAG: glycosyltransferase, partial [Pseudomonadota bacterium]
IAQPFMDRGIPVVVYFRNVEFDELGGDPSQLNGALFIANSQFTAKAYADAFGIKCTVIPPTIDTSKFSFESSREFVTLINLYPEKGYEKAKKIARACPEIPFLFVESWKLHGEHLKAIDADLSDLPNVTFMRRTNDMETVYGRTKILLAPSKWQEAWGRVASEAHCSSIPVVGSTRGGLPEAIGPGGELIDYDAPDDVWVSSLRKLWHDQDYYDELSATALKFSRREQMNATSAIDTFSKVLEDAVRAHSPSKILV